MPVIGHTFIGVIVAREVIPDGPGALRTAGPLTRALWVPAIVTLSYLPDVVTQCGVWLQLSWAQAAGHSVPVACVLGVALGAIWSRLTRLSFGRLAALAAGVIVLHDVMDLLQDAERMPFWPLSTRQIGVDWLMFTDRLVGELVVFGVPFAAYLVSRLTRGRPADLAPSSAVTRWVTGALVGVVLIASLGVVHLRQERRVQMDRAEELLRAARFDEALAAIDAAERWPSAVGHGDLLRGRVYLGMGQYDRAEEAFMRAHQKDPDAFWPTALLAEFHASTGPDETRRARSAPYVDILRNRFAGHEAATRVLERIDQNSGEGR
jgi:hypothetical protein